MISSREHDRRALETPQESHQPKHSHFTEDALKQRVCPVCGVVMPITTVKEKAA